jgi:hypothetical protein
MRDFTRILKSFLDRQTQNVEIGFDFSKNKKLKLEYFEL